MKLPRLPLGFWLLLAAALFVPLVAQSEPTSAKSKTPKKSKLIAADDKRVPTFELAELTTKPVRTGRPVTPNYPHNMRGEGIPGEVRIGFVIDEHGDTRDVHVVWANWEDFGPPAVRAVEQWKFTPGKKDGQVVRTRMEIPIVFSVTK